MLSLLEMNPGKRFQILDYSVCISYSANTIRKGMNVIILPPNKNKKQGWLRYLTSLRKWKHWIWTYRNLLKIDILSHHFHVEGLLKITHSTSVFLAHHFEVEQCFDRKYLQVARTLLNLLIDLTVVWVVSTLSLISKPSSPWTKPLVTVPRAQITIYITVSFVFHSISSSLGRSRYLSLIFLTSVLTCGQPKDKFNYSESYLF